MQKECINCDLNQVKKICKILNYNFDQEKKLTDLVKQELEDCDMSLTNPEVMGELWLKITKFINNKDPYKAIKKEYNDLLLSLEDEIKKHIHSFEDILNISIASNLIDFAAKHQFNQEDVKKLLLENQKLKAQILNSNIDSKLSTLAAAEGVSADKIPFLAKLIDRNGLADEKGNILEDKIKEAIGVVIKAFPDFKGNVQQNNNGFQQIGSAGNDGQQTPDARTVAFQDGRIVLPNKK